MSRRDEAWMWAIYGFCLVIAWPVLWCISIVLAGPSAFVDAYGHTPITASWVILVGLMVVTAAYVGALALRLVFVLIRAALRLQS